MTERRVGLEVARFGFTRTNVAWVEDAALAIRTASAEPATASRVRAAFA